MADPLLAKDLLLENASDSQRQQGKLPTPAANAKYLEGVLGTLDVKNKDRQKAANVEGKGQEAFKKEAARKAQQHGFELTGDYTVTEKEVPIALGGPTHVIKKRNKLERKLQQRIRLIRSSPDWHEKAKAINPLAMQGALGADKKRHAEQLWWDIIKQSNAVFGDWWKDNPKPLWFS